MHDDWIGLLFRFLDTRNGSALKALLGVIDGLLVSDLGLRETLYANAEARGYRAENVDIVIELERPKLLPHRPEMRRSIAALLSIAEDAVGVKAKTGEGLGPVGEGKMIAATAVVLLEKVENPA